MINSYPEAFYKQLEENPDDWTTRLVMADWYEDNGEPERAEAIRWQVENKRRPRDGRKQEEKEPWGWFDVEFYNTQHGTDPESDLPHDIHQTLCKADYKKFREDRRYIELMICEQDLQQAVMKHLAKQREIGE